jgi:protein KRI1
VHDCFIQSSGTGEAEGGIVDNKKRLISSHESNNVQSDQSSNAQKAKKKKKKKIKSEESNEFGCITPVETRSVPLLSKKRYSKNVCKKKIQKVSWQSDQYEKQKNPAISDARLRAYGMNPKKYKNKLKYGNNRATFGDVRH